MRTKQHTILRPPFFLLLILSVSVCLHSTMASAGFTVRDGRPISIGEPSQGAFLAFEENAAFWDPSWVDAGTALERISEANSINGDGKAWQLTLADNPGGGQKFSHIAWALQHLNVSSTTHLVLYVRGGTGGETFEVGLKDFASPTHEIRINAIPFIVGGGAITTNYKQIRIPLTQFLNRNVMLSNLDTFLIISTALDGQNITIYIDAMGFDG